MWLTGRQNLSTKKLVDATITATPATVANISATNNTTTTAVCCF